MSEQSAFVSALSAHFVHPKPRECPSSREPVPVHYSILDRNKERVRTAQIPLHPLSRSKSGEFRAATRLARLWHSQGKTTEVRDLIAPVYGWFTEGFDTADLKEAKALLDELS